MNLSMNHLGEIFILSKLFSGGEIILSACSKNAEKELIAMYLRSGNFIYYSLTEDNPVIKQIPWFSDSHHTPVSIHFSPSGDSLLVLSKSCNLYIIPAFSLLDATSKNEYCFNLNDVTILTFPFTLKTAKTKANSELPNSNFGILSCSSSLRLIEKEKNIHFNCSGLVSDFKANDIITKFKDISDVTYDLFPTALCWWQSTYSSKEVGIIGTKSGDIIFVDLFTGLKIGETSVKGQVKHLSVCQDNIVEDVFLLITVENEEQYKLILEQRHLNYVWSGKQKSNGSEGHDLSDNTNSSSGNGNGNGAPSTRARLQGLKQMSAEKLTMLKNKIAETRAKIAVKQEIIGEVSESDKLCGPSPENLGSLFGDTLLYPQYLNEENVLVGYYTHSQLLTVHSMNLDLTPLTVYKMPNGAEEILVCERVIYVVSNNRKSLSVISTKLSETWIESSTEFDPDWIIAKWNINILEEKNKEVLQYLERNEGKKLFAKPDLIPEYYSNDNEEKILSVYKSGGKAESFDIAKTYKLDTNKNESPDLPKVENCIVITNKHVYVVELKSNIIKVVLDTILEEHNLEKAERICTIFGISLQKLLELAGDIKLAALDFTMAIAFYKLSKCGLLKSIVKLACGNHCSQVLNYSTMLMTNSISDMSLTERIHLSNIVLMSYSEQILKNENNRNLLEKFFTFSRLWTQVGQNIAKYKNFPRLIGECGGKNYHFVHCTAQASSVVNGTIRSAFEFCGQKCSACSRMYVPESLWNEIKCGLIETLKGVKIGDPTDFTCFTSAVIDRKAYDRIVGWIKHAKDSPNLEIIAGGKYDDKKGYFIEPTIIETKDPMDKIMQEEIFGPVLAVYVYKDSCLQQAMQLVNDTTPYALTGAVFAEDMDFLEYAQEYFKQTAGNFYINDKSTGSVVGQQPFGGARLSGTNDKAGGPHYVLRWSSPQSIKETFVPLTEVKYPYMKV